MTWILLLILLAVECPVVTAQQWRPPAGNAVINPTSRTGANRFGDGNPRYGGTGSASWRTGTQQLENTAVGNEAVWNQSSWGPPANYSGPGFNWGYVSGGLVSAVPFWGGGCWSGVWGLGSPWLMPPAWVRNSDGAIFLPPTLGLGIGGYGYGFGDNCWIGHGFGYGPGFGGIYGYPGGWPMYGILPSLVNLQVNYTDLSYNPWIQSAASFSVIPKHQSTFAPQPGIGFDIDVPTDFGWQVPERRPMTAVPDIPLDHLAQSNDFLNDEFAAIPRKDQVSSAGARLQSLRYQTSGDDAFRSGEYASAEVFYQSAIQEAPDRRAPWLRMAFAKIAQQEFEPAIGHLKTGLLLLPERTRAWVKQGELYGAKAEETTRQHAELLWNWVSERPLSTDRLLLVGTFQQFRGMQSAADELLEMARQGDQMQAYVASIRALIADDQQHYQSVQQVQTPTLREEGIFMRGSNNGINTASSRQLIEDVPPVPVPPQPGPDPTDIQQPASGEFNNSKDFAPLVIPPPTEQ